MLGLVWGGQPTREARGAIAPLPWHIHSIKAAMEAPVPVGAVTLPERLIVRRRPKPQSGGGDHYRLQSDAILMAAQCAWFVGVLRCDIYNEEFFPRRRSAVPDILLTVARPGYWPGWPRGLISANGR